MRETNRDFQALAVRREKLEEQNRRLKLTSVIIALTGASLVVMGARPSDYVETPVMRERAVEAQEFLLKDADGRVHARLSLYSSGKEMKVGRKVYHMRPEKVMPGQASLQFFDENGEEVWVAPKMATVEQLK
jgi:hypothetical protein